MIEDNEEMDAVKLYNQNVFRVLKPGGCFMLCSVSTLEVITELFNYENGTIDDGFLHGENDIAVHQNHDEIHITKELQNKNDNGNNNRRWIITEVGDFPLTGLLEDSSEIPMPSSSPSYAFPNINNKNNSSNHHLKKSIDSKMSEVPEIKKSMTKFVGDVDDCDVDSGENAQDNDLVPAIHFYHLIKRK